VDCFGVMLPYIVPYIYDVFVLRCGVCLALEQLWYSDVMALDHCIKENSMVQPTKRLH
jgi:hypothetical protein